MPTYGIKRSVRSLLESGEYDTYARKTVQNGPEGDAADVEWEIDRIEKGDGSTCERKTA